MENWKERISVNPAVCHGKASYPAIESEDIDAALAYAAELVREGSIDLPTEAAEILRGAGFAADTVGEENLSGADAATVASASRSDGRILVTLDLDFANIRAYSPGEHTGIIILRMKRQDKTTVLAYVRRAFDREVERPWPTSGY